MNKREILKYGLSVFNNEKDKFRRWLNSPLQYLNGRKPCQLLIPTSKHWLLRNRCVRATSS